MSEFKLIAPINIYLNDDLNGFETTRYAGDRNYNANLFSQFKINSPKYNRVKS